MSGGRWSVLIVISICACGKKDTSVAGQSSASVPAQEQERLLSASQVTSSSEHSPSAGYTFVASNLIDGVITTSWQPAKSDKGPYWVRLEFDHEVTITEVRIANGFQTSDRYGDEFKLNRKVASGRLRFGNAEQPVRFDPDARGFQPFPVKRIVTRTVELRVDETHPGTKWNDLAISEIEVRGMTPTQPAVASVENEVPSAGEWWTPPSGGDDQRIEALAHGFAGIDEHDLGALFTRDLKPLRGAPNLFESKPARHVVRDEMQHLVIKLRYAAQLEAGFNYLIVKASGSYKTTRDYQVVRAMQVHEIVHVDDTARMRFPAKEAVFYLAEVHLGASYDLLVDGEFSAMGAQLDAQFEKAGGSAKVVKESGRYKLRAFGLGLRDTGAGLFAMTPEDIARNYTTGAPVPVQLVFRTVPGRTYEPRKLEVPQPVIDELLILDESHYNAWTLPAGRYAVEATSHPDGMRLSWTGDVTCDRNLGSADYTKLSTVCTVASAAELRITNPSMLNMGSAETVTVYVVKQP
jgi:hypothetical protein